MRILITGVTGSGGSYLAEYILENVPDAEVYGITRQHGSLKHKNVETIKNRIKLVFTDLLDFGSVFRAIDKIKPDIIFHIASIANVRASFENPHSTISNNVGITSNLLEVIRILKEKEGYDPIIQICSTSEVYGKVSPKNVPITENCPLQPANPYAVSKLTQDSLSYVYFLSYGLKIIRTRMFSYFNARRDDLFASSFAKQILDIQNGKREYLEHGNLDSVRTMLDVRDAARAYWVSINCTPGEVYNIGSLEIVTVGQILKNLIELSPIEINCKQSLELLRPADVTLQIPDITKFSNETGWKPKINLDNAIEFFMKEIRKYYV